MIVNKRNGVNWSTSGNERWTVYNSRKNNDSKKGIPAMFEEIDEVVGGYEFGSVITLMAATGRGKSWLGILSALVANNHGFSCLIESGEMSATEVEFRLDTLNAGFSNRGLLKGSLEFQDEFEYLNYTSSFTEEHSKRPPLIIKTPEDWPYGLTLQQLEKDIDETEAQFVVIDQFNLFRFKKATHEEKAALSRQLKQLAARKGIVIFLLCQTSGEFVKNEKKDAKGIQELRAPDLSAYAETIALQQDSNLYYSFQSVGYYDKKDNRYRGKAVLKILKARAGIEGNDEFILNWCPNDGVINVRKPTDLY
jgi:replicative DNA helicase